MPKAVRFDRYGDVDVLRVAEVERPVPGPGQALIRVKAAGINPGEAKIRVGALAKRWPATFPSGEGSDFAGIVAETGLGVTGFGVGDEVLGFTHSRASHAEYVLAEAADLARRPANVPWEVAGSLFVAGATAYAAVRAVAAGPGDTVVVTGAAGGVGSLAVQLARNAGAAVIGVATERHHQWLAEHGAIGVPYGDGVAERIRAAASGGRVDAFIDTVSSDYVQIALELGVRPERIDTITDFQATEKYGVRTDGNMAGASPGVLAELTRTVSEGRLEIPIANVYPLTRVQDAYRELERGHVRGKIVLRP